MRKEHWYWASGAAVFVAIVGAWIWQLPNIIAYAKGGKSDTGLSAIMSSLGAAKEDIGSVQGQLDANLKKFDKVLNVKEVDTAAVTDMKAKIEERSAKDIQTATVPEPKPPSSTP